MEDDKALAKVEAWAKNYLANHDRSKAMELRSKIDECIELADDLHEYEDDACNINEAINRLVIAGAYINEVCQPRYYSTEDDNCCEVFYIDDEGEVQILR